MSRYLLWLLFLFPALMTSAKTKEDTAVSKLREAIRNKQQYTLQKEARIAGLKSMQSAGMPLLQKYALNQRLYKEYRKFRIDSAIRYVSDNLLIATISGNQNLYDEARIQLANLYSSSGRYVESEKILKSFKGLSQELLPEYYRVYVEFYEHYTTNAYNPVYMEKLTFLREGIQLYRDSLLAVLDSTSAAAKINLAQQLIFNEIPDQAEEMLLPVLANLGETDLDYAMAAYLLGDVYKMKGNRALSIKYYAISATADIRNANKDNAAIQALALACYEKGEIDNAYQYTKSAVEDAIFCNVKFRAFQLSQFYSIINSAYLDKEARSKRQLQTYIWLLVILSAFLVFAVVYVFLQMKKVSRIKESLFQKSGELAVLNSEISNTNQQLKETNARLSESNQVKEEYIANFFDICSSYINKMENYRASLHKKAAARQFDELVQMLKSTSVVDNELEELYRNFDSIFLKLYPGFVKDFNALLISDEQVVLKHGELLNTELRIFALIRLGITDSIKIASFLRYSLSTIYNYRTRARNKAAVSRDEFEQWVMKIGSPAVQPD